MKFVIEIEVRFKLSKVWEDSLPIPALRSTRMPVFVVVRRAAKRDLAIDRRTAAQQHSLFVGDLGATACVVRDKVRPIVLWVHERPPAIRVCEVDAMRGIEVWACLKQADTIAWIGR